MNKEKNNNDKFITLKIVVNGTPTDVTINENAPLKAAAEKALEQTGNTGRDIDEWNMKLKEGDILDMSKKIKDFNFPNNIVLYLSLDASVGGSSNNVKII